MVRTWLSLMFLLLPGTVSSVSANEPISIGGRRELFIDQSLIDSLSGGARRELHHPVAKEIAITHDAPWEGSGCGYDSIFRDGDIYRMYYKSWHLGVSDQGVKVGNNRFTCYAESKDGIHWKKPNLGLYEVNGSKENNVILIPKNYGKVKIDPAHISIFKDMNPDCAPDAAYKGMVLGKRAEAGALNGLVPLKSADGIHWEPMVERAVITEGAFDSQNLAFWDPIRKEYRAYWRYFKNDSGNYRKGGGVRDILTATSPDYLTWSKPTPLEYPGAASEQLYVNQIHPYSRAPHLLIGFPVRYVDRGMTESLKHLPEWENREQRMKTQKRYGTAITEGLLMSSRDGVTFERWAEAFLRPGIQRPGTWNYGQQYIAWHEVETASDLPGAPPELSLYAVEDYWTGNSSRLRRYTLRLDGFVSVNAPMSGGEVMTKPLTFTGKELELNFSSSAAGDIRVELQNPEGEAIPGFTLSDSLPIYGDELARTVIWKNGSDVSRLADQPIRIRFVLRDADLYSFRFHAK